MEAPAAPTSADESAPTREIYLGTNLAPIGYAAQNAPFVDLMHHADADWISGSDAEWDDHRPIATDDNGWIRSLQPGQIARVFLIAGDDPGHLAGRFTVLYDGKGTISYEGEVSNLEQTEGRDVFDLAAPNGLFLNIRDVDAEDPIRNIRVLAPGGRCESDITKYCESDDQCAGRCILHTENYEEVPFHAQFLNEIRPFSAFRFMDWQETNREVQLEDGREEPMPVREWSQWPTRSSARWRPVPVEIMVELCNLMNADPWFNIPHAADDNFIRQFAQQVASQLEPERKVYVEYSNEVWNGMFDQQVYTNQQGCRSLSDNPRDECLVGGEICPVGEWNDTQAVCLQYGRRWFAQRSAEVARSFKEAFGDRRSRVIGVIGAQIGGGEWWVPEYLETEYRGHPVHHWVDAVAVAPYFGGDQPWVNNVSDVFALTARDDAPAGMYELFTNREDEEYGGMYHWIKTDLEALESLPDGAVDYIGYEGGQHLVTFDEGRRTIFQQANRDPRMEQVYQQYLRTWHELSGGAVLMHYTTASPWGEYGSFGALERQGAPLEDSPKQRALEAFAYGQ